MMASTKSEGNAVPDKVRKAEKKLEENQYDMDAWSVLVRDAQTKKIDESRPFLEKLVSYFPNSGRYWKIYVDQEMACRNYERVEKLFQRCLMKVLNIDLWKCYVSYVKNTKGNFPTYREKMAQAYDFALEKIGMDICSYSLWADYVQFLKGVDAIGSYAENQKITAVRRVYQRGCLNPMINIEQLWKDYVAYEQSINPILAEKMVNERSRDYMNARRVAKEYETVTRGLNRNAPSVPPLNTPDESKQVELWKSYITWEKGNPLRSEDQSVITKRVMFAYEQCLLSLGHHPDVWYEAALYLEQSSKILIDKGDLNAGKTLSDDVAGMYDRAITGLLHKSMLLYFAYADFEEGRMKYDKVHIIYKKFIEIKDIDPTLAYIQYMKFTRRAEGIQAARLVFRQGREDLRTKHHIFVAAALMEYYCSKEKNVAFRIFELGLKRYPEEPNYILAYIDYLSHLNEDNNTRVLFERVLTSSSNMFPEKQVEIWNLFLEFESNIGDLASILKVEKRRAAVIERLQEFEGRETALLVDRYKYLDLYPCTQQELRSIGFKDLSSSTSIQSSVLVKKEPNSAEEAELRPRFPKPDLAQMIPFKPRQICPPGAHPVAGGVFPVPPAASHLLSLLPPPTNFRGPFVHVDGLLEHFRKTKLPNLAPTPAENGVDRNSKYFSNFTERKRPHPEGNEDSDEENSNLTAPPTFDIYRSRQQKKVK
ncbi:Cleavage stimulation factor subunit 3 [Chamberlinius hualienensis]